MMRPCNAPEDVDQFCQLLRLDPQSQFTLKPTDSSTGEVIIRDSSTGEVIIRDSEALRQQHR